MKTVKLSNMFLAAVIVSAASGCSEEEDPAVIDDGGTAGFCPDRRLICAEDTICMETTCEPAFDRKYKLHLNVFAPDHDRERCGPHRDCPFPAVTVYYSEADGPVLDSAIPRAAEIDVVEGSSLIIETDGKSCERPLTADRLRGGSAVCTGHGVTATVTLDPMARESDQGEL